MKNILLVTLTVVAAFMAAFLLSPWPLWLGTLAAWVTTGAFFLQVVHIIKNKDTSGLSLGMWGALFFGVSCWAWYGVRMNDIPVMTANSITAILALTVIVLKLWHERPILSKSPRRMVRMPRVILKPRINRLRPLRPPHKPGKKRV